MKIVGIIAEYNPFHNGHQYHIDQALQKTGADAAVVLMSGDSSSVAPLLSHQSICGQKLPFLAVHHSFWSSRSFFPVAVQSCLQEVPFLFLTVLAVFPISALAVSVAISKNSIGLPGFFPKSQKSTGSSCRMSCEKADRFRRHARLP